MNHLLFGKREAGRISAVSLPKDWINPNVQLEGVQENAFAIMHAVISGLTKAGNGKSVVDAYLLDAKAKDFPHLVTVSCFYAGYANRESSEYDEDGFLLENEET